ncbi:hypothetical protein U6L75_05470 [Cutibacterium acnes]|jgi:hypothetical protein|uniref:hypothetical protein n=1 Tax=Cutibacterium acnes TaxID=1747 RepID=UPI000204B021|nr:hypothetical protein [Cutibacterium acnes]KFC15859.1 hypothetical protein PAST3_10958 [Cutibacterium acnes HL201PA1]EGE94202.1 hypothetical protein HMPREF9570_01211 [Cutibacterium acnes HL043PA1]EGE94237.1 hypothetical protein HMPREF9571_01015 [Cutibacterium acnes HL043PA2]KPG65015.1 hypothetical protein AK828_11100 [Cutibacterium acnes]KPG65917.1 hypothetical protein AK827_03565 [Cutibacterium acnes]
MTSNIEWGHNPDGRAEAPLYRAWAKMLVRASGLPWRIVAALAGISPTSMHQLLFGHNGRPVAWIGSDDARALGATNIDDLASAATDRIPARESRELLIALHTLGWTNAHLSRWLTSSDLGLTTTPKALYVTRLSAARIQATYDLLVSQPVRRHGRPRIPPVSSPTPAVLPQPRPNNTEPFQPVLFELADCA